MKNNNPISADAPKFRADELVVNEAGDEILIYDTRADKAHSLNKTAAFIWKNCDGETSVEKLAEMVEQKLQLKCDADLVSIALEDLSKADLISPEMVRSSGMSRRKMLLKYGTMAIALPVVATLIAPTAAQAQSTCLPPGSPCAAPAECCSVVCEAFC